MMGGASSLRSNDRGAVAIELGLAAPLLAMMLIGMVDLSTAYSNKLQLEQIAQRTIEKVQAQGFNLSDETALEAEAADAAAAAGFTGANADLTYWLECDGVRTANFTDICVAGPIARYIQLDIAHNFTPVIGAKFAKSNDDGTITVHGIAGIRVQ